MELRHTDTNAADRIATSANTHQAITPRVIEVGAHNGWEFGCRLLEVVGHTKGCVCVCRAIGWPKNARNNPKRPLNRYLICNDERLGDNI